MRREKRVKRILLSTFAVCFISICAIFCITNGNSVSAADDEAVTFSDVSGYYGTSFDLKLSAAEGSKIYYTTDGSVPIPGTASTKQYGSSVKVTNLKNTAPLLSGEENSAKYVISGRSYSPDASKLARATIIRAVAVASDGTTSPVSTHTYFVGNDIKSVYKGCAVISLVTDPDNLLNDETGIYVTGKAFAEDPSDDEDVRVKSANFMQKGKEWERAAYMEFFNGMDTADVAQGVGIRIHGGYSRRDQQKSLNIYFRNEYDYGKKNLKGYDLIPSAKKTFYDKTDETDTGATLKYSDVMLRNGGNDAGTTKFQDIFIQNMVTDKHFATQATRPCMLYLNGEFWGLYNLTEKYSDKYIEEEYDVDNNNVLMYKNLEIDEGEELDPDGKELEELMALGDLDMTKEENYKKFQDMVDMDSFLDYYATEIYINNNDWWSGCNEKTPHNNIQFWKYKETPAETLSAAGDTDELPIVTGGDGDTDSPAPGGTAAPTDAPASTPTPTKEPNPYLDGKWRYLLFDTEWSMGIYGSNEASANYDSIKYHAIGELNDQNEVTGSKLFGALLKNKDFQERFTNTLLDIRNWNYEYNRCKKALNDLTTLYTPLMDLHRERWNSGNISSGVNNMTNFLKARPAYVLTMLEANIPGLKAADQSKVNVSANVYGKDYIKVNTVTPDISSTWNAVYYKTYPINVTANKVEGYTFDHWKLTGANAADEKAADTEITLTGASASVQAVYKDAAGNMPVPSASPVPTATPTPTKNPWGGGGWGGWGDDTRKTPTPAPSKKPATPSPAPTKAAPVSASPTSQVTVTTAPTAKAPSANATAVPSQTRIPVVNTAAPDATADDKEYSISGGKYRIVSATEAVCCGPSKKTVLKFAIPTAVKLNGKSYKVISIADSAFKNCKKLKSVTIGKNISIIGKNAFKGCGKLKKIAVKSSVLKTVGSASLSGISKKAVIKVPAVKLAAYKSLFKGKGQKKTVKYVK